MPLPSSVLRLYPYWILLCNLAGSRIVPVHCLFPWGSLTGKPSFLFFSFVIPMHISKFMSFLQRGFSGLPSLKQIHLILWCEELPCLFIILIIINSYILICIFTIVFFFQEGRAHVYLFTTSYPKFSQFLAHGRNKLAKSRTQHFHPY